MATGVETGLAGKIEMAARVAGLEVTRTEAGQDFLGDETVRFDLARMGAGMGAPERTQRLELSAGLDLDRRPALGEELARYLAETAMRLRNPRPDGYVSISGLPLEFRRFGWPFHASTSGADTFLVHGEVWLADGEGSPLHAKVSASMTQTFKEVVAAMEQPFAEGFIYNAVRKTMDQGQLELVKSGNRQPVPVTTRYYSAKQNRFIFNDTTEAQRTEYLASKLFWMSGVLGGGEPVWLLDPRDAQYLNTTVAELGKSVQQMAAGGLVTMEGDGEFGAAAGVSMAEREKYVAEMQEVLLSLKPSFNESMRGGQTNM